MLAMQPARDGKRVVVFACICQARARRRTRRETLACSEQNPCATDLQREGTGDLGGNLRTEKSVSTRPSRKIIGTIAAHF